MTLLRVLIVEDSEDDAQLILRQLRSGSYHPRWERVDTLEAMASSLDREQWDVIICDYKMPRFSAPAALKLVQEREIDIPFIIVSGAIGEDTAVAIMKSGAHDYVMKDKLARLVVAVEREIREAKIRHEKKKTEEELQRSEQSFKSISENAHDGIIAALRDGAYIYANRRASEITGYTIDEILKAGIEGLAHPDESLKLSERRKKILAGENVPNQYETVIIHKGGNPVPIEITSARTLWYGQTADIFILRDIAERRRAEEALRKSEEYFKELTENSSDIIIITDKNGDMKYCSRSIERFTGYKPEELIGKSAFNFIHPDDVQRAVSVFGKAILTKDAVLNAFRIVHKDGSERHFEGLGRNLLDNPSIAGFVMNVRDVTECKRAELALRESEERYATLFQSAAEGILVADLETKMFVYANPSICRMLGYSEEELKILGVQDIHPAESLEHVLGEFEAQARNEKYLSAALPCRRKDGSVIYADITASGVILNKRHCNVGFFSDVTDRKLAEEALKKAKVSLDLTIDASQIGVWELDLIKDTSVRNLRHDQIFGYEEQIAEWGAKILFEHIITEDRPSVQEAFDRAMKTDRLYFECRILWPDKSIHWITVTGKSVRDSAGKPQEMLGTVTDITERKQAEEALRETEERYKSLFDNSLEAIYIADMNGNFTDANPYALKLLGYEKKEIASLNFLSLVAKESAGITHKISEEITRTGSQKENTEYKVIKKDGTYAWIETHASLLYKDGKPVGLQGIARDITERKQAEELLRKSESKYRLLAENASDVITVMDMNMRPIYMSPSVTRLLGYSVEEALARGIESSLTPESVKVATKRFAETMAKEQKGKNLEPETIDLEFIRKDGSKVWVAASVAFIHGSDGQIAEILSILHDISERKQAEKDLVKYKDHLEELVKERTAELDKAKVIAEQASKAKSEFLANMSHEIRTPLSTIIGFSELLADETKGPINDDQKKYLGYVTSSGHHLLSLINDILDLSKVEAGKMELQKTRFSMSNLLKNSSSFIEEKAVNHNIRLLSEFSADVDVIEADERKVKQIIYNLLSNAVKFTPDGGSITVGTEVVSPNSAALPIEIRKGLPDTKYVLISVKDTGIGIAKKDQSKLFTEFSQIEEPYTKKYEGTGLGLALTKRLVTLHGGKIWFESKGKDKGCTFYFILPLIISPKHRAADRVAVSTNAGD